MTTGYGFKYENYKLTIEPLTPIHIGSGEQMFPYLDYIIDGNNVNYLDSSKAYQELTNEELKQIYDSVLLNPKKPTQAFRSLSSSTIKEKLLKHSIGTAQNTTGITILPGKYLYPMVRTNNYPYIPGSSIKGAFCSAIGMYGEKASSADQKKSDPNHAFGFRDSQQIAFDNVMVCDAGYLSLLSAKGQLDLLVEFIKPDTKITSVFLLSKNANRTLEAALELVKKKLKSTILMENAYWGYAQALQWKDPKILPVVEKIKGQLKIVATAFASLNPNQTILNIGKFNTAAFAPEFNRDNAINNLVGPNGQLISKIQKNRRLSPSQIEEKIEAIKSKLYDETFPVPVSRDIISTGPYAGLIGWVKLTFEKV